MKTAVKMMLVGMYLFVNMYTLPEDTNLAHGGTR